MNAKEIERLLAQAEVAIEQAATLEAIEAERVTYLGRKGHLPRLMKGLKDLAPADRAAGGQAANRFKNTIAELIETRKTALQATAETRSGPAFDYTLPGQWVRPGTFHPVSRVIADTADIFRRIGFTVAEGPDVETRFNNFEALNTPAHHPTLDDQDTFWLGADSLLRTQTSPVQIRVMTEQEPPIRVITPGRCYRRDTTDATHSANFHQIEGIYVDRDVSLADLKGVLLYFAKELMGPDVRIRFRPHFFPFTEPSVECDFSCHLCGGDGCRVCKQSGWIEICGAGMVDPRVFAKVGYDAEKWTGFAFGMGVERIAMIKYGIEDIRLLYENDVRYLAQFKLS